MLLWSWSGNCQITCEEDPGSGGAPLIMGIAKLIIGLLLGSGDNWGLADNCEWIVGAWSESFWGILLLMGGCLLGWGWD